MKKLALTTALVLGLSASAEKVEIGKLIYRGPVPVTQPVFMDSVDVNEKSFDVTSMLEFHFNPAKLMPQDCDTTFVIGGEDTYLHFVTLPLSNNRFSKVNIGLDGSDNYRLFLDGKKIGNSVKLRPGDRELTLKFLTLPGETDTVTVSVSADNPGAMKSGRRYSGRAYTLDDVLFTTHVSSVDVSPSGKYVLVGYTTVNNDKKSSRSRKLIDMKKGNVLGRFDNINGWIDNQDLLWGTRKETDGSLSLFTMDPLSMSETVIASDIPQGDFIPTPDMKRLVYLTSAEGPKEDSDIYRVINPEDRQPGWRTRRGVALYDIENGLYRPLTFGNKNVYVNDISQDGKKLLLMSNRHRFEKRPTTLFSLYLLDIDDMTVDTLVVDDGFITGGSLSPDGRYVAVTGSPEALNSVGKNVPEGRIPNMTEGELFLLEITSGNVKPITKNFNPSIQSVTWNEADGTLWFTAENRDRVSLYCYNPTIDKIEMLDVPEDIVIRFSLASKGRGGALIAESAINPDRLYAIEYIKNKPSFRLLDGPGDQLLDGVALAEVVDWDFVNSKGDTINGRFYLPPGFNPDEKYPLIVNYYGGCSPTGRNFATRYPHHLYANQGYVVYVINPSGATGFGQEFASRHVNTAGEGVAEDIIEGTSKFLEEHPFINPDKIGCIGASYGGFMTQYLQTVTDMFAAAISHAGISDHTGYWGEGYWGYSYSEVSMADSYPWSDAALYVLQSPLYNADKVTTPILFLHGDGDTNVPPSESIQMFTALKLLGKDTALVEVTGQNHHILDYDKRQKWQDTIFAWFAKYLQDDPTWWNELYPPTTL